MAKTEETTEVVFETRVAEPHTEFGYTSLDGEQKTLKADASGHVRASDVFEDSILIGFDLPTVKSAKAEKE